MNAYLFLTTVSLSLFPTLSLGQTTPRNVAVVDVGKVFTEYNEVKVAKEKMAKSQKIFKEEMGIYQSELKKLVDDFNELQTKLKNPSLDTPALRNKGKDMIKVIKQKESDIKQYQSRTLSTLRQREQNLLSKHTAHIREAIEKVAKAKNLDLVLSSAGKQFILFAKPAFDVTDDVIKIVNATVPK